MNDLLTRLAIYGALVAFVFIVAYVGRRMRLSYSRDWPVVQGTVEGAYLDESGGSRAQLYLAYSYYAGGEYFAGKEPSPFGKPLGEVDADSWKGKRVLVRYNPKRPEQSVLWRAVDGNEM